MLIQTNYFLMYVCAALLSCIGCIFVLFVFAFSDFGLGHCVGLTLKLLVFFFYVCGLNVLLIGCMGRPDKDWHANWVFTVTLKGILAWIKWLSNCFQSKCTKSNDWYHLVIFRWKSRSKIAYNEFNPLCANQYQLFDWSVLEWSLCK